MKKVGGYIDCLSTVSAAREEGLSICEYVESLWGQKGETDRIIDHMQRIGCFKIINTVCEIGPGTGRYLQKILDIAKSDKYLIYETAEDWAIWLSKELHVQRREADGKTLHFEPDCSCDLVHAHGVFVYLKFLQSFKYFKEMIRVCRPGGYIVFDFYSEQSFGTNMINRWLKTGDDWPEVISHAKVKAFFKQFGAQFVAEFTAKYSHGYSTYHVYQKQDRPLVKEQREQTVSVVIPTYNRSALIGRAINSVLKQTRQVTEIIVVDDGSSDNTRDVVESFDHPGIKYIPLDRNHGAQRARNVGIREAVGEWIGFLDSDDEWLPVRVEKALASNAWSDSDISYCEYIKQDVMGNRQLQQPPAQNGKIYIDLLAKPFTTFPGLFAKRHCLLHIEGLDERIISWQEWETSIRLARHFEFSFIAEPLFIWHWHEGPTISKDVVRDADGYVQVVEKHKDEILTYCGVETLISHYLTAVAKYVEAGAIEPAIRIRDTVERLLDPPSTTGKITL